MKNDLKTFLSDNSFVYRDSSSSMDFFFEDSVDMDSSIDLDDVSSLHDSWELSQQHCSEASGEESFLQSIDGLPFGTWAWPQQ